MAMKKEENHILHIIKERRSIRKFNVNKNISNDIVKNIIEAASYAPSGHNNQPWRFSIIKSDEMKKKLSNFTAYSNIVKSAGLLIAVFFDKESSYDRDKDLMAIGACIQNMLLYISSIGLGAVWLGEILKNKEKVREALVVDEKKELMAVIAIGFPDQMPRFPGRKTTEELILNEF